MKVLIKQANIISSASPFHGQVKDILIVDGFIAKIADIITENTDQTIIADNLHLSIGWMDIFADFADPGYEQRESLVSGAAAAAAGGFTDIMLLPNTNPVVSSRSQVEYIRQKAGGLPVSLYPIAAITNKAEGAALAEMYDMHSGGAIAFSDGTAPVQRAGVLLKALQYILAIDTTIIQLPDDRSIAENGLMSEGIVSTQLGLPGKPALAEELMIARDIELLRYSHSKLHFTGVSTKKGLELIAAARVSGLQVSASVTPYHCFFCDEDLATYDTNLKLNPPLRSRADMMALREALLTDMVDCLASHHLPQHQDDKVCEFEYAKNGMIGLESMFGVLNSLVADTTKLVEKLTVQPRKRFNLPVPQISEGAAACLTLFDPSKSYTFEKEMIRSASFNSAFIGKTLKGKVIGIINKNQIQLNNK